jgi:NAD-dependent oxidoreductase involved in siderophore biosynthesis
MGHLILFPQQHCKVLTFSEHLLYVSLDILYFFCGGTGSCYIAQASLGLAILLLQPLSAGITGMYHHAWL